MVSTSIHSIYSFIVSHFLISLHLLLHVRNLASIGKEFNTRAEWRDYMVLNFYSFKNKVGEAETLIKPPGSIDGQGKCASVPVVCVYLASKDHIRT